MRVVSLDDARTWTATFNAEVDRLADRYEDMTDNTTDLGQLISYDGEEGPFRRALDGTRVKVYHATRLLEHEYSPQPSLFDVSDSARVAGLH